MGGQVLVVLRKQLSWALITLEDLQLLFLRFQGRRVRVLELLLLFILIYHLLLLWFFRLPALFFP